MGVTPDVDYEVIYSGKHDNSIMGVANGDYEAAPIASSVLERMVTKDVVNMDDLKIIWESDPFPTTSYGFAYNLNPELQEKIREAFLTFDWKGTALEKEFGKQADKFCAITFEKDWKPIRIIQKENGTVYSRDALNQMKVKK
jgi:phosphonate transport system substrate-binding protein